MDENRHETAEGRHKHDALNEDSGVSSRGSHEAAPSIDKEIAEEIRPLVVAEMKRYAEKLRRIRQHYESKLKKFEDMQVEWIAMRDQEEIALRVSREQEREIDELQQQVASAKEEVRKTKRLVSELTEKAAKSEAARLDLLKMTAVRNDELSLLECKIESLKLTVLGNKQEGVGQKRCESGGHNISNEKTKDTVRDEECLEKARQLACDLDAIHNEVQMAISGVAQANEYPMRSELENEFTHLKEKCAHWKREAELLLKKQAELKERLDEVVPITEKMLGSLTGFASFLQQQDCNDTNIAENSCIAIGELCDKIKARLSEPSDKRASRKCEMSTSAAVVLTNGCQQYTENEEAVVPPKITRPSDSKQVRRGQDPTRVPHEASDMMSREMKLVFGGVVRTKIVEEVCSSTSVASTSKGDQCDVRRILVIDSSPSRGRRLVPPKKRGADNFPDPKSKRTRTMQQYLKQTLHAREEHPAITTPSDSSGDEEESRDNKA